MRYESEYRAAFDRVLRAEAEVCTIYVTGPRNEQYGYDDGVLPITAAAKYHGTEDWDGLEQEAWNFDLDEDTLAHLGVLRRMYAKGNTLYISTHPETYSAPVYISSTD